MKFQTRITDIIKLHTAHITENLKRSKMNYYLMSYLQGTVPKDEMSENARELNDKLRFDVLVCPVEETVISKLTKNLNDQIISGVFVKENRLDSDSRKAVHQSKDIYDSDTQSEISLFASEQLCLMNSYENVPDTEINANLRKIFFYSLCFMPLIETTVAVLEVISGKKLSFTELIRLVKKSGKKIYVETCSSRLVSLAVYGLEEEKILILKEGKYEFNPDKNFQEILLSYVEFLS